MYGYIYKTTNLVNNKFYIGQKKSDKFLAEKYLGSGIRLNSAIKSHGKENFKVELIDTAESKQELNDKEIYWVSKLDARNLDIAYNLAKGGDGPSGFDTWNKGLTKENDPRLIQKQESIDKRAKSLKKAYEEGRHSVNFTPEIRKKMSDKAKNRPHPPTTSGRICYTNGQQNKLLKPEQIDYYISLGWYKGKTCNAVAWNKGLTKETSKAVRKYTESRNKLIENGQQIGFLSRKDNHFKSGESLNDYKQRMNIIE